MHTGEPLIPELGCSEIEIAIAKLKTRKYPDIDRTVAELILAGGNTLRSEVHKLINSICNKVELPHQWTESVTVPAYKKRNKTDCSNYRRISFLQTTYKMLFNSLL